MPIYEGQDGKDAIPANFNKETVEIVEMALLVGWKLHITGEGSMTIIAPDGIHKHHFTPRRNSKNRNQILKSVARYSDPALMAIAFSADHLPDAVVNILPTVDTPGSVIMSRPEDEPKVTPAVMPKRRHEFSTEPKEATIVSEKPMVAKAGESRGYTSVTTIERKWSDGSMDYVCAYDGCDFASPNRKAPSGHYAATHTRDKGTAKQPESFRALVPNAHPYAPREGRIRALAELISELMGDERSPEDIARVALTWVHEQSRKGTELSVEREEMSAEDMLHRIRLLLDDGRFVAMQQEVEALTTRLTESEAKIREAEEMALECQAATDAAESRARRAQDTLQTLTELAREASEGSNE